MNYVEVSFSFKPYSQQDAEIIMALLADLGFDSFSDTSNGLLAYIHEKEFANINLNDFSKALPPLSTRISWNVKDIKAKNWNKIWESNFQPITVENLCRIRAPFHQHEKGFKLEVIIEPKMAFGTGHHQTTWLMIKELFQIDLENKTVLDMGCGTGILAIVAEKLGASQVTAIDNDTWAYNNAIENATTNGCNKISVRLGDATAINNEIYDVILANINLNILVTDIETYCNCLKSKGKLLMSGILESDIDNLTAVAKENNLIVTEKKNRGGWSLLSTQKK